MTTIPIEPYYSTYHGHEIEYLQQLHSYFQTTFPQKSIVYFAGDSSLDNKYWLSNLNLKPAVNGYQNILEPPRMKQDICYHLNSLLEERGKDTIAINTSIEATFLRERSGGLMEQDLFIREHITERDTLIVSVGGNDIALGPTPQTIFNIIKLLTMNSEQRLESDLPGAWGAPYFIKMFKDQLQEYIEAMISKRKPQKVIICMIYYPDESSTGGWADTPLKLLGYNSNPGKLQLVIREIFKHATSQIQIPGTTIVPFAMFDVLNGKNSEDYVERVEPSIEGGLKLAKAFFDVI